MNFKSLLLQTGSSNSNPSPFTIPDFPSTETSSSRMIPGFSTQNISKKLPLAQHLRVAPYGTGRGGTEVGKIWINFSVSSHRQVEKFEEAISLY
jgi:hypothetical protein